MDHQSSTERNPTQHKIGDQNSKTQSKNPPAAGAPPIQHKPALPEDAGDHQSLKSKKKKAPSSSNNHHKDLNHKAKELRGKIHPTRYSAKIGKHKEGGGVETQAKLYTPFNKVAANRDGKRWRDE